MGFFHHEYGFRTPEDEQKYREYQKSRMKSHLFQGYQGCTPGRWLETNLDDFHKDFPDKTPRFWNKQYYFVQYFPQEREYGITPEFGLLIFYFHTEGGFRYLRSDGTVVPECNLFESEDEAIAAIKRKQETAPMTVQVVEEHVNEKICAWKILHGL